MSRRRDSVSLHHCFSPSRARSHSGPTTTTSTNTKATAGPRQAHIDSARLTDVASAMPPMNPLEDVIVHTIVAFVLAVTIVAEMAADEDSELPREAERQILGLSGDLP